MKYGICPNFWNNNPAKIPSGNADYSVLDEPISEYPTDMQDWLVALYSYDQVNALPDPYRRAESAISTPFHDCTTRCLQHRFNGKSSNPGVIFGAIAPDIDAGHGAELLILPRYIPSFVSMGVLTDTNKVQVTTHHRLNPDWVYSVEWMDNYTQVQIHSVRVTIDDIAQNTYTFAIDDDLDNELFDGTDALDFPAVGTEVMFVQGDVRENQTKNLRVSIAVPEYKRSTDRITGNVAMPAPPTLYDSVYTALVAAPVSPEYVALRLMELKAVRFYDWALLLDKGWFWNRTFDGSTIIPPVPEENQETVSYFSQSGDLTDPKDNCVIGEGYYASQRSVIAQIGAGAGNFYIVHNSVSYGPFTYADSATDIQTALSDSLYGIPGGTQITVECVDNGSDYYYIITWFGFGITRQTITIDKNIGDPQEYTGTITQAAMIVDVIGASGYWAFIYADENVGTFAYDVTAGDITTALTGIVGGPFGSVSVTRTGAAGSFRYLINCASLGDNTLLPLRVNLKAFGGYIYLLPRDILQINGYVIPHPHPRDGAITVAWDGDTPGARSALLITDIADSGGGLPIVSRVTSDMFSAGWGSDTRFPTPTGNSIVVDFLWSLPIHIWAEKDMQCNYVYQQQNGTGIHLTTFGTVYTTGDIASYSNIYYLDDFEQRLMKTGTVIETGIYYVVVDCDQEVNFKGNGITVGWPSSPVSINDYLDNNGIVVSGNSVYNLFTNYNHPFEIVISDDDALPPLPRRCALTYWLPYDNIVLPSVGSQVYLLNHNFSAIGFTAPSTEYCETFNIENLSSSTTDSLGLDYHNPANDDDAEAEIIGWDSSKRELYCNGGKVIATHIPEKLYQFEAIINVRDSEIGQGITIDNGITSRTYQVLDDYKSYRETPYYTSRPPGFLKKGTSFEGVTVKCCVWQEPGDSGRIIETTFDDEYYTTPEFIPYISGEPHTPYISSTGVFMIEKMRIYNMEGGTLLNSQYLPKQSSGDYTREEWNALLYDHDQRLSISPAYASGTGIVWPTAGSFDLTFNGNSVTIPYNATSDQIITEIENLYDITSGTVTATYGRPAYITGNWPHGYITIHQEPFYGQLYYLTSNNLTSGEVFLNGEGHVNYCGPCSTFCSNCFRGIMPGCVEVTVEGATYVTGANPNGTYNMGLTSFSPTCTLRSKARLDKGCCFTGAPWNSIDVTVGYNDIYGYYYSVDVDDYIHPGGGVTQSFNDIYIIGFDKPVCTAMNFGIGPYATTIWTPSTAYFQNEYVEAVGYGDYKCISPTGHISSGTFIDDSINWHIVYRHTNWEYSTISVSGTPEAPNLIGGEVIETCKSTYFDDNRCYRCIEGYGTKYATITVNVYEWLEVSPGVLDWAPAGGGGWGAGNSGDYCAVQDNNSYPGPTDCTCTWSWYSEDGTEGVWAAIGQQANLNVLEIFDGIMPTCGGDPCCKTFSRDDAGTYPYKITISLEFIGNEC